MAKKENTGEFLTEILPELQSLRHEIHQHPETAGKEKKTAKRITSFLEKLKPDNIISGIGGNGLIAEFDSGKEGPVVLFRSELDALPIRETCEVSYKSEEDGVSHKCGHDGHMAILCGFSKMVSQFRPKRGKIQVLFQPAEETGEGAHWMLDDEKIKKIKPDYIFALHNVPGFEKSQVITRKNIFSSASVGMIIRLKGMTSHASHPENGKNPALAMSHIIEHLIALPQLTTSFDESALVTIIHAKLGEIAFGTSPGYAEVMATLRAHENSTLNKLTKEAERIAKKTAELHQLDVEVERTQKFEATVNDEKCVDWIENAAKAISADFRLLDQPFSWSEDFGRFTSVFKGAMFGLGSGKKQPQLHHSDYDFPDDIIETGVMMFYNLVDQIFNRK